MGWDCTSSFITNETIIKKIKLYYEKYGIRYLGYTDGDKKYKTYLDFRETFNNKDKYFLHLRRPCIDIFFHLTNTWCDDEENAYLGEDHRFDRFSPKTLNPALHELNFANAYLNCYDDKDLSKILKACFHFVHLCKLHDLKIKENC